MGLIEFILGIIGGVIGLVLGLIGTIIGLVMGLIGTLIGILVVAAIFTIFIAPILILIWLIF